MQRLPHIIIPFKQVLMAIDTYNFSFDSLRIVTLKELQGVFYDMFIEIPEILETSPSEEEINEYGEDIFNFYDCLKAIKELSEPLADFLTAQYLNIIEMAFELDEEDLEEFTPISNIEAFVVLRKLNNSQLKSALSDLSQDKNVRFELLNMIKEDNYEGFSELISKNKLSSLILNSRLAFIKFHYNNISIAGKFYSLLDNPKESNNFNSEDEVYLTKIKSNSLISESYVFDIKDVIIDDDDSEKETFEKTYRITLFTLSKILWLLNLFLELDDEEINIPFIEKILKLKYSEGYKTIQKLGIKPLNLKKDISIDFIEKFTDSINEYNEVLFSRQSKNIESSTQNELDVMIQCQEVPTPIDRNCNNDNHLEFPTRLTNNPAPDRFIKEDYIPIMTEIYNTYGGAFENMSCCEEFLYLFGATSTPPSNYNPPYYWCWEEATMKALLRILYNHQPRILKSLILHISDKSTGEKEHDWGRNKNRVAYRAIEDKIVDIVKHCTGKNLKRI